MKSINVVAAIIKKGNRIFAAKRGYGEFKGGWEFPGGKVEPGETPQSALEREIKEELDAEIIVDEKAGRIEYDYPTFHLSMECFWCHLAAEHMDILEHEEAKWLSAEELDDVEWLPADISLVGRIKEVIK